MFFNSEDFGVFLKSCHETSNFVFVDFRYFISSLFFFNVLNSISSKNGLYSAINFIIDILSFSLAGNFPPSVVGLNVQTTLFRSSLIISNVFGICSIFKKSNLTST